MRVTADVVRGVLTANAWRVQCDHPGCSKSVLVPREYLDMDADWGSGFAYDGTVADDCEESALDQVQDCCDWYRPDETHIYCQEHSILHYVEEED